MANHDSKRVTDDAFDLQRIRQLIELMKEHDLMEIDLRREKQQIRLARGMASPLPGWSPSPATSPAASVARMPAAAPPAVPEAPPTSNLLTITSPMVGTIYLRPNPNAEPFVKPGDRVMAETVVCIIEAMKVFNDIAAEISGKIVAVLVADQDSVEFGTPLFRVDPQG